MKDLLIRLKGAFTIIAGTSTTLSDGLVSLRNFIDALIVKQHQLPWYFRQDGLELALESELKPDAFKKRHEIPLISRNGYQIYPLDHL